LAAINKNFVVRNGLEVDVDLLVADATTNRVGIGSTNPQHTLDVRGGIGATSISIGQSVTASTATISTVTTTNLNFISGIGTNLVVTGVSTLGITTATQLSVSGVSTLGITTTTSLSATQLSVSGVSTLGITTATQLSVSGVSTFNSNVGVVGLITSSDLKVSGIASVGTAITMYGATGIISAYKFFGDGSGLTGTISGIGIRSEGVDIGYGATVIDFKGPGVSTITNISAGIVTVFFEGGGGGSSQFVTTAAGIHTLSNVGIGTTNPRFKLEVGAVGASGTSLHVNGDARITGILSIGQGTITLDGSSNIINVGSGITLNGSTGIISATSVVVGGTTLTGTAVTSIVAGTGITISGPTGEVTINATGAGSSQFVTTAAGIHTLSNVGIGTTNPTSALTVSGDVNISGVTTTGSIAIGNTTVIDSSRTFVNSLLKNYSETVNVIGDTGLSRIIDLSLGNYVTATLNNNTIFTFTVGISTGAIGFVLQLKNNPGITTYSITWPVTVYWPGGGYGGFNPPTRTTTPGRTDVWVFNSIDGGANWYGNIALYDMDLS